MLCGVRAVLRGDAVRFLGPLSSSLSYVLAHIFPATFDRLSKELFFVLFIFFFSSRRRHTRCLSDWSSDVCSSDLVRRHARLERDRGAVPLRAVVVPVVDHELAADPDADPVVGDRLDRVRLAELGRSEERRVGKERRCRWGTWNSKKQNIIATVPRN